MMPKKKKPEDFDYEKEAGEYGKKHAGTSETGRFWGSRGAGVLFLAESTGRILLTLRSKWVNEPHTWGLPGGAIDEEESPASAARREAREEIGYRGKIRLIPTYVFKASDFQYHNFLGIVPEEFEFSEGSAPPWEPKGYYETEDAQWFDLDDLPSPLHFGVRSLLKNSRKLIRDTIARARRREERLLRKYVQQLLIS